MDLKGKMKYQELIIVSRRKLNFFNNNNMKSIKNIYSFLSLRDRIKMVKVNRLFKTLINSKTSLKFISKLKSEIKSMFLKDQSLNPLLFKEAKFLNDFIQKFCKNNGGDEIKKYVFIFLGVLMNKIYLENKTLKKFNTEVNIQNSCLFKKGAEFLASILINNTTLTQLILPNNSLGGKGFRELIQSLTNINTLIEVDFSGNFIEKDEALFLSRFLSRQIKIKTLKLYNCLIKDEGIIRIAQSIQNLHNLENIFIGSNLISTKGLDVLMNSLKYCENLLLIDLKENLINSFKSISNFLSYHNKIILLDLSMNQCSPNLLDFGDCLTKTKSLDTLNLNNCNINYFSEFLDKICSNSSLVSINLSYNIPKDADQLYNSLCRILKENTFLQEIIWLKGIEDRLIQKLTDYAESNGIQSKLKIKYIWADKVKIAYFNNISV